MTDPIKPKPGRVAELRVEGLTVKGQGVAAFGDYRVTVRGAIPGDTVVSRFRKVRHRRREGDARIVERVSAAVERQPAPCAHFGECGGCLWQDLAYEEQLRLKERIVTEALRPGDGVDVRPSLPAPAPYGYRNKMEFSVGSHDGKVLVGLHPAGRFGHVVDVGACELMPAPTSEVIAFIRAYANEHGLSAYDLRSHEGLLRFVTVRATRSGDLMVNLTTSADPFPEREGLATGLSERFPCVVSVVHTVNREKAQVAYGDEVMVVAGQGSITETLGPYRFEVSPFSFFQPNAAQAEAMFERVVDLCALDGTERVLDAYCGTGGISLYLAPGSDRVLGVEASEDAVRDAARNSASNGVTNCSFVAGPAEDLLGQLCRQGESFNVAVTDPPRAGMHHKALRGLIDLSPDTIVYVSCNPAALATDAAALAAHGYRLNTLQLVDMLPQTPHCEVIARLCRT